MNRRTIRSLSVAATLALVLGLGASLASACPMCADALPSENSNSSDPTTMTGTGDPVGPDKPVHLAEGFYYSILLMLAVPYLLAGGAGGAIYWTYRKRHTGNTPAAPIGDPTPAA